MLRRGTAGAMRRRRIGIYSGTFNPVHAGHVSFALQALNEAKLDRVYLMPERHRANKKDVAHFAHRVAMIRQAIKPHPNLGLIEAADISFTVAKTLPKLRHQFRASRLVFLMGSDSLASLANWPLAAQLLKHSELVIGVREGDAQYLKGWIEALPIPPRRLHIIDSLKPGVSSTKIREALRRDSETDGMLTSVRRYSNRNWVYISLS